MKRKISYQVQILFLIITILFFSACNQTTIPQATPSPSAFPTTTKTSTATNTPLPTATPTFASPVDVIYQIVDNAPEKDVELIKEGIAIEHWWAENFLGGDPNNGHPMTVVIEASGLGNVGACCTAMDNDGPNPRPFFDTKHPIWLNFSQDGIFAQAYGNTDEHKLITAAHEYAHSLQSMWGCMGESYDNGTPAMWWTEGWAEYAAYTARSASGRGAFDQTLLYWRKSLNGDPGVQVTLDQQIDPDGFARNWTRGYGQGFFAINYLADKYTVTAVVNACKLMTGGKSLSSIFPQAFNGLKLVDFYDQVFPAYLRDELSK